jgi:hypothetical protein
MEKDRPRRAFHPVYLLLLLPLAAYSFVSLYNRIDPTLLGIPFFYWWQTLWIPLSALCIFAVYRFEQRRGT